MARELCFSLASVSGTFGGPANLCNNNGSWKEGAGQLHGEEEGTSVVDQDQLGSCSRGPVFHVPGGP